MRLKSFYAKTMSEAMQMVRETLGEDAVIVATREEKGSKGVHVTAAIEPAFELGRDGAAGGSDWLQYDAEEDEMAVAEELTEALLRHSAPEDVMDQIISCATVAGLENPGVALIAAIEHLYTFRALPRKTTRKPLMMVGPPGAGKTLAVAKTAARGTMSGLKISVITADTVRAGGVEQLQTFTKLMQVNLLRVKTPQDLQKAIADSAGSDQIIIDTPGINPYAAEEAKTLSRLIGVADVETLLVLPAGVDCEESGEIARIFAAAGATGLLPTRIDMSRRLGGLLCAASRGRLSFADASNTPKVADGLVSLTPQSLAKLIMPLAYPEARPARPSQTGTRQ